MAEGLVNALCIDADDLAHANLEAGRRVRNPEARVAEETEALLGELEALAVRATFFVPGIFLKTAPAQLRMLAEAGHEVASHGFIHCFVWQFEGRAQFAEDVRRSKRELEQHIGREVDTYKAPIWSFSSKTPWAYDVLIEEGFRVDHSATPRVRAELGLVRDTVTPFLYEDALWVVPTTFARVGGWTIPLQGGFFNARVPFPWLRRLYDGLNAEGTPFNLYFHPFEHSPMGPNRSLLKYGSPFISLYASHVGRYRPLLRKVAAHYRLGPLRSAYARWIAPPAVR